MRTRWAEGEEGYAQSTGRRFVSPTRVLWPHVDRRTSVPGSVLAGPEPNVVSS